MTAQPGLIEIFGITLPIFILIALGYGAVRLDLFSKEGIHHLSQFLIKFGLPALLFSAISRRDIAEVVQIDYLFVYGIASAMSFFVIFQLARILLSKGLPDCAIYGMGSSMSNSIMIGFPVMTSVIGPVAAIPFALSLMVENFLMMPLTLILADMGKNREARLVAVLKQVAGNILKNPFIIAIFLGLIFSLWNLSLPAPATRVIDLLSGTVTGLGLFIIGGLLVGFDSAGKRGDITLIVIGKLFIHPLSVLLILFFFPTMDQDLKTACLIMASVPMLSIFPVIGQKYNLGQLCAASILPTTVVSFFTITLLIWLLARI